MSSSLVRNVQRDTVVQRLEHFAAVQPDKVAWTWYDDKLNVQETFTYKEIDQASSHLADTMREQWNIKTNDVVVLVFAPGLQFALSLFACFKAGAIGVPVYPPDPTKAGKELLHFATICQDCGAKFALSHNLFYAAKQFGALSATVMSFFAKRETSWPDLQWFTIDSAVSTGKNTPKSGKTYENAKLAFLQYTSGSTSAPKGVMMTHQNIAANCFATEDCNRKALNGKNIWTTDVIVASWLPMYHDMGLIAGYMLMMYSGGEGHYFSPITFLRAPLQWLRLLHRTKATFTGGPNFSFSMVLKKLREATPEVRAEIKSLDFSHIDVFVNGAEPLEINLFNEFLEEFAPQGIKKTVHAPCYGMAECTLTMAGFGSTVVQLDKQALIERRVVIVKENEFKDGYHAVENTKALVSCGRWSEPIHVVRIVDPETCEDLGDDKIGEIWMNGDSKAAGYWGRSEEANAEVFGAKLKNSKVAAFADLAFLRTGDYGFTHKGQLYITGRMKDMIIVNGFKHYPQDVERSAESANKSLSPGRSAAFAVRDQAGAATESCVIVMELKPDVDPSQYAQICRDVQISVSRECSLYLQGIYLLQPKTICKTTSGKISRNFNAVAYGQKKLKILHSWEDFDSGSAPAPVASVVRAAVEVLSVAEIKAKIVTLLRTVGGVEESVPLDDSTNLIDLGIHSAVITELSVAMATELAVNVRPMTIFSAPSLGGLSARIQQMLKDQANAADRSSNASDIESDAESEINGSTGETGPVEKYEGHIAGWGIATPLPITTERFLEIEEAERRRIGQSEEVISNMKKFVKSSQIVHRYSCQPFWLPEGKTVADYPEAVGVMPHDIYGPAENHNPKYVDRLSCFKHTVLPLCINAAEKALKNWGGEKQEITHIITTCTSGWTEPGIGCAVIKGLKLREDIQKQELNFNGCFCGATCLRIARDFIRAGDATAVMIVACEVASSQANWSYTETELLVMQSLFADGAAAIIVAREGIWRYDMTGSAVVPESSSLLGLRPPQNDNESSYVMTLSPKVAPSLYQYFTSGFGKTTMKKLYNGREQRPALAIHPGGPRILEAMNDVFQEQGFKEGSMDASYHTFRNNGNLGCAAMLFVLAHRLSKNDIEEDSMITMAFGPGVTVEWAKLVRADSAAGRASAQRALSGNASTVCARPVSSLRSSRSATPAVIAEKYRSSPISTKQLALTPPSPATAAAEIEHASTVKELTGMRVNMQRLMIVVLLQSLGLFAALGAVVFLAVRK